MTTHTHDENGQPHSHADDDRQFLSRQGSATNATGGAATVNVPLTDACPVGFKWELRLCNWYGWPTPSTVVAGSAEIYVVQNGQTNPAFGRLIDLLTNQAAPGIGPWSDDQVTLYPGETLLGVFRSVANNTQIILNVHFSQLPMTGAEARRHGGRRNLVEAGFGISVET